MKKFGYIQSQIKPGNNNRKKKANNYEINNNKFKKSKQKLRQNLITSGEAGPPSRHRKNNKKQKTSETININKKEKNVIINSLKIVDNSSSINYLKTGSINLMQNLEEITNKNKKNNASGKKKIKKIVIKSNKSNISKIKNKPNLNTQNETLPNVTNNNIDNREKNKNLKNFSLINIQLNLSGNHKNIPPDSHIILNNYNFKEAVKYDLRELCVIFYIFALAKQIFFRTFLFRSPLELFSLRLCLFLFIISCHLALNALFYFNSNISKRYRNAKNIFLFAFSDDIITIFALLVSFMGS